MSKQFPNDFHIFRRKWIQIFIRRAQESSQIEIGTGKIKAADEQHMHIRRECLFSRMEQTKTFEVIPRNWTLLIPRPHINLVSLILVAAARESSLVFAEKI